jgi:hypothetical protein
MMGRFVVLWRGRGAITITIAVLQQLFEQRQVVYSHSICTCSVHAAFFLFRFLPVFLCARSKLLVDDDNRPELKIK